MEENNDRKTATEHAWKWFEYHASQRLTTLRFFILLASAFAAAFVAGVEKGLVMTPLVLAGVIAVLSLLFWKLDRRNSDLVKAGEEALRVHEEQFARTFKDERQKIVERAERKEGGLWSYSKVLYGFFVVMVVVALIGVAALIIREAL